MEQKPNRAPPLGGEGTSEGAGQKYQTLPTRGTASNIPSKPAKPPKPRSMSMSGGLGSVQYTATTSSPNKVSNIPVKPPKPPKPKRSMSFSSGLVAVPQYSNKTRSTSDTTDTLYSTGGSVRRTSSDDLGVKRIRRSNSVKEAVLSFESKAAPTTTATATTGHTRNIRSSSVKEGMLIDVEPMTGVSPLNSPITNDTTTNAIAIFDAPLSPTRTTSPSTASNMPSIGDPLYPITEKTSSSQTNSPAVIQKDSSPSVTPESLPDTVKASSPPLPVAAKGRPPPPKRPPPPMSRPPRPFPPPPPSSSLPLVSEAKLAKKRPPPTPPLIIDSRHSPQHTPHSVRSLKTADTGKDSSPTSKAPPQRPPRPVFSPVQINLQSENSPTPSPTSPVPQTEAASNGDTKTHEANATSAVDNTRVRTESEPMFGPLSHPSPHSPSSSPSQGRKVFGKVKESFRNLRRNKTVHHSNSREEDHHSPTNWRRVLTVRSNKPNITSSSSSSSSSNERYPDTLHTGIVDPLLVQCVSYLNKEEVLKEPGLFRIPGDLSVIKRLRRQFVAGEFVDLSEIHDPNIITGLLKVYFREKPVPLISNREHLSRVIHSSRERNAESFKEALEDFDDVTLASLRMLSELFKKIAENSEDNHMTSGILATSCGPSFFPNTTPSNANGLVKFITDNCDTIFSV